MIYFISFYNNNITTVLIKPTLKRFAIIFLSMSSLKGAKSLSSINLFLCSFGTLFKNDGSLIRKRATNMRKQYFNVMGKCRILKKNTVQHTKRGEKNPTPSKYTHNINTIYNWIKKIRNRNLN